MPQNHNTRLRVVSLRWTTDPNVFNITQTSVPEVVQVDSLSEPNRTTVVNHAQSFDRMIIPYTMNFAEAKVGGIVIRRPRLKPRFVRFNGGADTFYEVVDWVPEIYVWQATDDLIYFARAADGMPVLMESNKFAEVDFALRITFQRDLGSLDGANYVSSIVLVPVR
jgi:hypothetical protein